MEMVEVGGLQIAYERVGSGPALVLLHDYVGDGPTTWRRQLDGLSDEFTVVAWDAPGAGRSSDPPERFGLDGYADCLAGFLERLGLDHAYVAGLSFGGILALALQRRHSAVSSALVLASAYAGWAGSLPPEVAEQRLRQALALADGAPEAFVAALAPTMFSKPMPRETVDDFRSSMQAFHPRGFRAMARASAEDVRDVLPHVEVPTFAGVRRPGRASAADGRRGAAGGYLRLEARRPAGRRSRLQLRSSRRIQHGSTGLPPRQPQLDPKRGPLALPRGGGRALDPESHVRGRSNRGDARSVAQSGSATFSAAERGSSVRGPSRQMSSWLDGWAGVGSGALRR
jgi:pimeloyl-ACP methyl ester carboxylesterase